MSDTPQKYYSAKDLSERLSVSDMTVKNWIKLGKINPDYFENGFHYFSEGYVKNLIDKIKSDKTNLLKSRRNKKYVSGSSPYKDYISKTSKNLEPICSLNKLLKKKTVNINLIVAEGAVQLIIQKKGIKTDINQNYLLAYMENRLDLGKYNRLIDDLIQKNGTDYIKSNPQFFNIKYTYEKNEDILGFLYLSLKNIGERKSKGAYYTPTHVVKSLISNLNLSNGDKILDPCCGSGNFLLNLSDKINIDNIYGNDTDSFSINLTRINMALKYDPDNIDILYSHFTVQDFLKDYTNKDFNYIIGNPPWGSEFSKSDYNYLKKNYQATDRKNIEAYDVFVEKSLSLLRSGGVLSFVLPEAILNVKTHKKIREIILANNSIKYLEYLENIFNKVQCPSVILEVLHNNKPLSCIGTRVKTKTKSFVIKKERQLSADIFALSTDDEEYALLQKLLNPKNKVYLKSQSDFALGIVTGNNDGLITDKKTKTNEVILKGSDIEKYKINKSNNYIEYKPENFQQCAKTEFYRAKEKLIYRFISTKLIFGYDNEQTLTLNSCNVLIPRIDGLNMKYVMAILNSSPAQFIFEKLFNSVKVLRSHIESIPIPVPDNKTQTEIIQLVDKLLSNRDKTKETEIFDEIDEKVANLYNLTESEKALI